MAKLHVDVYTHARPGERVLAEACLAGRKSRSKRVRTQCAWEIRDTPKQAQRAALSTLMRRETGRRATPPTFIVRLKL